MATRVKEQKQKEIEKQVYCGPNIPGLTQFTVLSGIPKFLELHLEECSAISKLIVPVSRLNETRLKLSIKGSYEQKMYGLIKEYLGGVK